MCVDTVPTPELLGDQAPVVVPSRSTLTFQFDRAPREVSAGRWHNTQYVKQEITGKKQNMIVVPSAEGTYMYEIFGNWIEGDVGYSLVIAVR